MTQDIDTIVALSRRAAAYAQTGELNGDVAVRFCAEILPALLVEFEVAKRVDARLTEMFPAPAADTKPVAAKKPTRKKAAKKKKATK